MKPPSIDPDIRQAETMPGAFYRSAEAFDAVRERVFARSWQWVGTDRERTPAPSATPIDLLPGYLDEPLALLRDREGETRCVSNVCTHRANLVVRSPGACDGLRCQYHGRRFDLAGRALSMPEFEGVEEFPAERDHLPSVATGSLGGHRFVNLDPAMTFDAWTAPVTERLGELPLDEFRLDRTLSRDYLVHANWALYVDNYLEGLHIPFVHPELAQSVEFSSYAVETFDWGTLQLARPRGGEPAFDGPLSSFDGDERRAAYYFWLFPNTMLNVYPWGLSVNVVQPLALDRTRVAFRSYVWKPELVHQGAGGSLDKVEREDEVVVEFAQRGVRSRLYKRGRYAPRHEAGVHRFHQLLCDALR